jgi:hypothetical protein
LLLVFSSERDAAGLGPEVLIGVTQGEYGVDQQRLRRTAVLVGEV